MKIKKYLIYFILLNNVINITIIKHLKMHEIF